MTEARVLRYEKLYRTAYLDDPANYSNAYAEMREGLALMGLCYKTVPEVYWDKHGFSYMRAYEEI